MNTVLKRFVSRLSPLVGLVLVLAVPAAADTGSYGYVRILEGSATLMQAGSSERSSAEVNQPVLAGDRLWVPGRSRVELVLADRNMLRLDGDTELVLEHLAGSPDGADRATVLRLLEGNLQLAVTQESLGDELPRIETPNATIYVQHYGVYRITADRSGWTQVVVRRGTAEVVTDRDSEEVRADEEAVIDGEGNARIAVQEAGAFDTLERWAGRLDEEYADTDARYVEDDNLRYQAAPLARYGSWINYQGSSYWRPTVSAGWRPYWQGRWAYTPAGLTWISSEPWGWVPYHYGSWDFLPAHGWAWRPGYTWSPAWVYWYWGPSYVGWCPTGYYTHYYGSRFGAGFGFRYGVYGWAGGDWGHFNRWNFISAGYFRDGYRHGNRNGHRDGYWDGRQDVPRFAVPVNDVRARGTLDRGIITTDTKPLRPTTWQSHDRVLTALDVRPNGNGREPHLGGSKPQDLPDVTPFVARKPDLPTTVVRTVGTDAPRASMDRTPVKPSTAGRGATARSGRWDDGGSAPAARGAQPGTSAGASKPRDTAGDNDGQDRGGRTAAGSSRPSSPAWERPSRPDPGADGGAPRPGNGSSGSSSKPGDRTGRPSPGASAPSSTWERPSSRPAPDADGGSPRPDSSSNEKPRYEPSDRDRTVVRPETPDRDRSSRPEPTDRDRFVRPDPSDGRDRSSRPEPSYKPAPKPAPRPDSNSSSSSSSSSSASRSEPSRSSSPPSAKPSSPPSSRSRAESSRPPRDSRPPRRD